VIAVRPVSPRRFFRWVGAALAVTGLSTCAVLQHPTFVRVPQGAGQAAIEASPNYRDGAFQNANATPTSTDGTPFVLALVRGRFEPRIPTIRPSAALPAIKTDLRSLPADQDVVIWLGHSSYCVQLGGRRIPKTARSQVIGGMTMGVGAALMEELAVDTRLGLFVNHDLAGYEVPVHADIPHQDVIFLNETDPTSSPMKAKGVGELGICGTAAAVANAVYNATGVRVRDYPITLDKLLQGLPSLSGPRMQ